MKRIFIYIMCAIGGGVVAVIAGLLESASGAAGSRSLTFIDRCKV